MALLRAVPLRDRAKWTMVEAVGEKQALSSPDLQDPIRNRPRWDVVLKLNPSQVAYGIVERNFGFFFLSGLVSSDFFLRSLLRLYCFVACSLFLRYTPTPLEGLREKDTHLDIPTTGGFLV